MIEQISSKTERAGGDLFKDAVQKRDGFPYVKFRSSIRLFFLFFFASYIVVLAGIVITGGIYFHAFTISTVSSIIAVTTLFFDFELLRGMMWSMLPTYLYALVHYIVVDLVIAVRFVITLPHAIDLVVIVYVAYNTFVEGGRMRWTYVVAGGFFWLLYVAIITSTNLVYVLVPASEVDWFYPYIVPLELFQMLAFSIVAMAVTFYILNRHGIGTGQVVPASFARGCQLREITPDMVGKLNRTFATSGCKKGEVLDEDNGYSCGRGWIRGKNDGCVESNRETIYHCGLGDDLGKL